MSSKKRPPLFSYNTPKKQRVHSPKKVYTPLKSPHVIDASPDCYGDTIHVRNVAINYIKSGRLTLGLEYLINNNNNARNALQKIFIARIQSELNKFRKKGPNPFRRDFSSEDIDNFDWESTLNECQDLAPTLTALLSGAMPYMDKKVKGRKNAKRFVFYLFGCSKYVAPKYNFVKLHFF
jgi:hypothetical protein